MMISNPLPDASTTSTITVRCRMFGRYSELLGTEACSITLQGGATADDVARALRSRFPQVDALPAEPLVAINRRHVRLQAVVEDGDEVAFLPPLAGG